MIDTEFMKFVQNQLAKKRKERMFRKYVVVAVILGLMYAAVNTLTGCTESTQQTKPEHHDFKE